MSWLSNKLNINFPDSGPGFAGIALLFFLLAACGNGPILSSYRPVPPELPKHWKEILGEPHWYLEWVDGEGIMQSVESPPGRNLPEISPAREWTTPVLVWPFWPARNLLPGMMRPAGALFPWDAAGEKIRLSWKGGVDAFFWKSLAGAAKFSPKIKSSGAAGRFPWYFDWPRFRELFDEKNGSIPERVHVDPWLADWKEIAANTVRSGFNRRRIKVMPVTELVIPGLGGLWIGSSPFSPVLDAPSGGSLRLAVSGAPDTWVSRKGILKCSGAGWVFQPGETAPESVVLPP